MSASSSSSSTTTTNGNAVPLSNIDANEGYDGFDHLEMWVSNAKQAASWYSLRFGFTIIAYKGLETGSRELCSYVLKQGNILMVITCPLNPVADTEICRHLAKHGDHTRDVAFRVVDTVARYRESIAKGGVSVAEPHTETDEHGSVVLAAVKTYGDTIHTFVQRSAYKGLFLPGYKSYDKVDPMSTLVGCPNLEVIDHVVGNQPDQGMMPVVNFYEKVFNFHRFWSVDDKQIHTQYSALRSVVMASPGDERIKMPINEPAVGKKKSQIQEYVDYHGDAGVQHVALRTENILHAIAMLRARGVEFLSVPAVYYTELKKRLAAQPSTARKVEEDLAEIEKHNILVDFDEKGYLLQIFTKPVQDRPTLFFEIIQRRENSGFGAGNFKALFESIEIDQAQRGNL